MVRPASSLLTTSSSLTTQRLTSLPSDEKKATKRKVAEGSSTKSRKKQLGNDGRVTAITRYQVKPPKYELEVDIKDVGISVPDFVSPALDPSLKPVPKPLHDINGMKVRTSEIRLLIYDL